MIRADWRTFGFVVSKLGLQASLVRSNGMIGATPPPGPRLYVRCGTIMPNEKNLVEKFPKMVRW